MIRIDAIDSIEKLRILLIVSSLILMTGNWGRFDEHYVLTPCWRGLARDMSNVWRDAARERQTLQSSRFSFWAVIQSNLRASFTCVAAKVVERANDARKRQAGSFISALTSLVAVLQPKRHQDEI